MHPPIIQSLLSDHIIRAICWTLVHSLWQGLLLAIFAAIAVLLTRRSGPLLRYNLLSLLFFAFLLTAGATFFRQVRLAGEANPVERIAPLAFREQIRHFSPATEDGFSSDKAQISYINSFAGYFNLHASLVVTIWFIIFSARFVRVVANLGYVQRVRHYKTHAPADYWKTRLMELAEGLDINKHIALLESELVKVPLMLGFLKPLILVPFGLLAQLPPAQVEAILLHELAHIKRKDYLVNLLQSLAETIFFFNPAVLWISSLIREERENCCDDIAIGKTNSKKEFIYALVAFQEYQETGPQYGIGFSRSNNHLLNRIKRIVSNNNKTLNNMEKIILASAIVLAGFLGVGFSQISGQSAGPVKDSTRPAGYRESSASKEIIRDSVPRGKEKGSSVWTKYVSRDGKKYRILEKDNKVIEFYIDGQRIPDEKIAGYQHLIDEIKKDLESNATRLHMQADELHSAQQELKERQEEISEQKMDLIKKQMELARNQQAFGNDELSELQDQKESQNRVLENQEWLLNKLKMEQAQLADRDLDLAGQTSLRTYRELVEEQKRQIEILKRELEKNGTSGADIQKKLADHFAQESAGENERRLEESKEKFLQQAILNKMMVDAQNRALLQSRNGKDNLFLAPGPPTAPALNMQIVLIIDDLLNEKIINSEKEMSFELNNKELIVNRVVQSPDLHARLKGKYIKTPKDHFIYSDSNGSTHQDVNTNKP